MKAAGLNMSQIADATGVQYNTIRSYLVEIKGKQTGSLSGENEAKIAGAYNLAVEDIFGPSPGAEARPNFLRAWREFKTMTADELADALGVPVSTVTLWEGQPVAPSDKWLRRVGAALQIPTGFISEYDPNDLDTASLELALSALKPKAKSSANRGAATAVADKTGTDG